MIEKIHNLISFKVVKLTVPFGGAGEDYLVGGDGVNQWRKAA
jgi:hypothetical protein